MNLTGIGSTATAITGINTGRVTQIYLNNPGFGYTSTPVISFTEPPSEGIRATAVAIMTSTSFGTQYIDDIRIVNPGSGYSEPPIIRFISSNGVGAAATAGISTLNSIGIVTITSGGSDYVTIPTVTFSSPPSGITATGIASVEEWDAPNRVLKVGMITGDFKIGENIVGSAATFTLKSTGSSISGAAQEFDTSSFFDDSVSIESEGINIIDFTEKNPFGNF